MTDAIDNAVLPILVAIDFSEDSRAALLWACKLAECTGAPLVLLHVVHDLASHPGFYHRKGAQKLEPMMDVAESMMDEFVSLLTDQYPQSEPLGSADVQLVPGLPPTRIVEVAKLLKASLIAIGSRGATSLPHRLLGAVAEKVVELSPVPVVVVKSETHGELGKKEKNRREKQQKKDRKKLKDLLGLGKESDKQGDMDE